MKNTHFSANKSPYLRKGAGYDHGYCEGLIGSHICGFDWYHNRWPWTAI